MVNNCLVTKLKGTVNNTDLKYLNGIVVERKKMDDAIFANMTETQKRQCRYFYFVSPKPYDLKIIEGNTYFTDNTFTQNYGKELKGVIGSTVFIANADDCKVLITDDYQCSCFLTNNSGDLHSYIGTGMTFDLSDFKFRTNLEKIAITGMNFNAADGFELIKVNNGDIQNFANCVNLKYIHSRNNANLYGDLSVFSGKDLALCVICGVNNLYPNLTGNIEVFASMPSLTTLDLHYSRSPLSGNIEAFANNINMEVFSLTGRFDISATNNIEGNLNTLLDAWYTNGKRGNVLVGLSNTKCTYNGAAIKGNAMTFVFDENGWSEQA
jgi:hypothetical protein